MRLCGPLSMSIDAVPGVMAIVAVVSPMGKVVPGAWFTLSPAPDAVSASVAGIGWPVDRSASRARTVTHTLAPTHRPTFG